MTQRFKSWALGVLLLVSVPVWAGACAQDMAAVDKGLKAQYGGDGSWWMIFACPVDMGSRLKKDAIVTPEQIKSITSMRNLAYIQMGRGDDALCVQTLAPAKRLLRVD
jgi:hypothetical protein